MSLNLRGILAAARKHNASDIHLLAGLPPMLRINGDIVPLKGAANDAAALDALMRECLNPAQLVRLETDWQLCVSLTFPEIGRVRITVYRRGGNTEMCMRMSETTIRTREQLGLPKVVDDLARKPQGLVLVTGPTGVGKTTTFNYILDLINSERSGKIVTIEDPIEYVHPMKRSIVVQQELLTDVHDFSSALRHVLRQDPDVIGIGELRDRDTIHTALVAAETGHLVIGTLHTPGAADVVQRLVSAFEPGQQNEVRYLLANTICGVVAQQLLPRAGGSGMVLAAEVLMETQAVRHHIRENTLHQLYSEMQGGRKHGMQTLDHALEQLYQRGEITYDTAKSLSRNGDNLKLRAV
mgnify:CR=1 FL=1